MANRTDPLAAQVHGTNPQNLVEKITRLKIYDSEYWKTECFGLTAETLVDKAVQLKYFGGTYGGNNKPTPFLCLLLKMLQLQPEREIVLEYIKNEDFKYVRVLGAFYWRLTARHVDVYKYLEPLYDDYRKIIYRSHAGWVTTYIDQFVDDLLNEELVCDIALPRLMKRYKLEELDQLPPRESALEDFDLDALDDEAQDENQQQTETNREQEKQEQQAQSSRTLGNGNEQRPSTEHREASEQRAAVEHKSRAPPDGRDERDRGRDRRNREDSSSLARDRDRDRSRRRSRTRSRSRRRDRGSRRRRSYSSSRSRSRSRGGRRHSRRYSSSRSSSRGRSRRHRRRSSRSLSERRDRRRDRDRSRSRSRSYDRRRDRKHRSPTRSRSPSRRSERWSPERDTTEQADRKPKADANKKFDKIFGKKSKAPAREDTAPKSGEPSKDTVEYWNAERAKLGLKPLKS